MANGDVLNTPVLWINKYLQEKIEELAGFSRLPFFPSTPTALDDLTEMFPEGEVMAVYDRLIKMNRKGFPHIKCEQILYYFYATSFNSPTNMVKIQEAVLRLMDRFDETAEEINNWCSNRQINLGTEQNPDLVDNIFYFHNFKIYQLEETRDIIDFGTARTYGGNKIIIDFDYHQKPVLNADGKDSVMYTDWKPEKLATKIVL
jgi:hypothetical protein